MDYFNVDYDYLNLEEINQAYRSKNEDRIQAEFDEFIKDMISKFVPLH